MLRNISGQKPSEALYTPPLADLHYITNSTLHSTLADLYITSPTILYIYTPPPADLYITSPTTLYIYTPPLAYMYITSPTPLYTLHSTPGRPVHYITNSTLHFTLHPGRPVHYITNSTLHSTPDRPVHYTTNSTLHFTFHPWQTCTLDHQLHFTLYTPPLVDLYITSPTPLYTLHSTPGRPVHYITNSTLHSTPDRPVHYTTNSTLHFTLHHW